jgi:hypothetical protein
VGCAVGGAVDCADKVEAANGSSSIKTDFARYFIDLLRRQQHGPKISTEPDLNRGALTDQYLVAALPSASLSLSYGSLTLAFGGNFHCHIHDPWSVEFHKLSMPPDPNPKYRTILTRKLSIRTKTEEARRRIDTINTNSVSVVSAA